MKTQQLKMRIEEIPTVAMFVKQSYLKDKADFEAYSPKFDAQFETDYNACLDALKSLINSRLKIGQIKLITEAVNKGMDNARPLILRLEGYALRAKGLDSTVDNFGFKKVRSCIDHKDAEGFFSEGSIMMKNVENNMDVLKAEGYTDAEKDKLKQMIEKVAGDNLKQNDMINEKERIVQENTQLINNMKGMITLINDTGKRLYKFSDEEKTHEYTMSKIMSRIRRASNNETVNPVVTVPVEGTVGSNPV